MLSRGSPRAEVTTPIRRVLPACLGLGGDLLCVLGGGYERAAFGRERPAGLGEPDLAPAAVEQRDAQLVFQLQDRLAQRRL